MRVTLICRVRVLHLYMSQALINELRKENLCTYFILPLIKLNKQNFVTSNFVNCYLSIDGKCVVVSVVDKALLSRSVFNHAAYTGTFIGQEYGLFLVYQLPSLWRSDVEKFMQGEFSKFSKAAKEFIVRYSGLSNKVKEHGTDRIFTDGRLLALDKHPVLKGMWERELSDGHRSNVELEEMELLSIPGTESYLDISSLSKAQP